MQAEDRKGLATYWQEKGSGEPVILIHGVGMDHTMWQYQTEFLASYYRVITYDMLGHGNSGKPGGEYKLDHYVSQLLGLMDQLSLDQAHIVGFSMGGMVAQLFGIIHPDKVKTLTFMNAVANRSEKEQQAVKNRVKQVEREGHQSTIDAAIDRWFNEDYRKNNPDLVEKVRERLKNNDADAYLKSYKVFAAADQEIWPQLNEIKKPTLVITGEGDVGSTPLMAEDIHEQLSNSELVIFPGFKHMLPMENYEAVNETIFRFIEKHR
ncbi:alpha/beta fold hydrolase [Bacillus piscicola]|uniref:alpha/beta fold hydrolase n=1 Tax=Bacillus piscicola TaxID=1632684 RepID=UPI001F099BCC|nr:alpha/beta fold hydrolase [Bacillus piscicola]